MTKADLLAAIAEAADDAIVYIDNGKGLLASAIIVELVEQDEIVLSVDDGDEDEEEEVA